MRLAALQAGINEPNFSLMISCTPMKRADALFGKLEDRGFGIAENLSAGSLWSAAREIAALRHG